MNETTIPKDCYWTQIIGGGNWIYLVRPREFNDPKVYGAKEL